MINLIQSSGLPRFDPTKFLFSRLLKLSRSHKFFMHKLFVTKAP